MLQAHLNNIHNIWGPKQTQSVSKSQKLLKGQQTIGHYIDPDRFPLVLSESILSEIC
jgi:hypothetical protein